MQPRLLAMASAAALALAGTAAAAPVTFDFASLGANNTPLASSVTVNGVTAAGYNTALSQTYALWLRNVTNDHGLGVCSEGTSNCTSGGGDVNELDNSGVQEAIRLTRPDNSTWTSLWVSSLDVGGSGNSEEGRLLWSNSANFSSVIGFADFTYGTGAGQCNIECNILGLSALSGFDATAKYVLFAHVPGTGDNNDYLVWKGTIETGPGGIPVPEPMSLALFGLGLAGLGLARGRRG